MINRNIRIPFLFILYLFSSLDSFAQPALPSTIPVYADANKGDSVWLAIEDLFAELKKVSATSYTLSPSGGFKNKGILFITTAKAGKHHKLPVALKKFGPEGIYIRGDQQSVIIAGNTKLALHEAIYIYLEQLGFRYLAPGEVWEVIPPIASPYKKMEVLTQPHYEWRSIANGHGFANHTAMEASWDRWMKTNRMGGAFRMWLGHSYDAIVQGNQQVFKEHPEYFANPVTKGTLPVNPKFNVANAGLVKLISEDAVKRFRRARETNPALMLLSMDPSDGGGFCTTADCKRIGSVSDQVFYLANHAARSLRQQYPDAWVGSYAYNEHILPTNLKLEPNVFVMVTNGFNRSSYNTYQLLNLWGKKAKKLGVYEYLSVYEWDNDLPGQMGAAQTDFLKTSVRKYYENGARAYLGESVMGWVSKGWGQYLLARLLWNYRINTDSLKNDFFDKAFENVSTQMRSVYDGWERSEQRIPGDNALADWLSLTDQAYKKATSEKVRKRIDLVKMYLHYVVMQRDFKKNPTKEKYYEMMHYANRSFETGAFATLPTMVSMSRQSPFPGTGYNDAGSAEWKRLGNAPLSATQVQSDLQTDISSVKRIAGLETFRKADGFVALDKVVKLGEKYHTGPNTFWHPVDFIIHISSKGAQNYLTVAHGSSADDGSKRALTMDFYKAKSTPVTADDAPVFQLEQPEKNKEERMSLAALSPGYYLLKVNDWRKMFLISFSPSVKYSIVAGSNPSLLTTSAGGLNTFYFYVPRNVRKFIVHKTAILNLTTPKGRVLNRSNNKAESFEVTVEPGEGGVWQISGQAGNIYLEGVPPYLGTHPAKMLVPSYLLNQ